MTLSFVDIETTGTSARHDRIIEIGILRVEGDKIVKKYNQLINPETYVSPFITQITGIHPEDLESAPTFEVVKDEVYELLQDSIFVAHNVHFDHGFLKNEFRRFDMKLALKQLCTVKLSRTLFPEHRHHNLDAIIERFDIHCSNRHRAYDDAHATWQFYQKLSHLFPSEILDQTLEKQIKRPSIPTRIQPELVDTLPEGPGVYMFYGERDVLLYVGKSKNIRKRVMSHFSSDHRITKDVNINRQLKRIETIPTAGELGALLKEASLIKKMQPMHNVSLRKKHKFVTLFQDTTKNGYFTVRLETREQITKKDLPSLLEICTSKKQAKELLKIKATEYHLCEKLLNKSKSSDPCFGYKLDTCNGACINKENPLRYNIRFIEAFGKHKIKPWPFPGKIIIREHDSVEHITDTAIVDQWCLMPDGQQSDDIFDHDIYKILIKYILKRGGYSHLSITAYS